jgi:hypothetical protein
MNDENTLPFWVVVVVSVLLVFEWLASRDEFPLVLVTCICGFGIFIYDGVKRWLLGGSFALGIVVCFQSGLIGR